MHLSRFHFASLRRDADDDDSDDYHDFKWDADTFHERWGRPSGTRPGLSAVLRLQFMVRGERQKLLWEMSPPGLLKWFDTI